MPNHVTNKVTFDAALSAEQVRTVCREDGCLDFEKLIPSPPHMYRGNLSSDDENDFPCNWLSWHRENWGTKWGAYDGSLTIEDGRVILKFDTAWSAPYPIMAALANKFGVPFEHRYFDEGHGFWGIDTWGTYDRTKKKFKVQEDFIPLCIELKEYDPTKEEEDAPVPQD